MKADLHKDVRDPPLTGTLHPGAVPSSSISCRGFMRPVLLGFASLVSVVTLFVACGTDAVNIGGESKAKDGGSTTGNGDDDGDKVVPPGGEPADGGPSTESGPLVEVHVVATHAPTSHPAGTAGQTPITHSLLIQGLSFFTGASDTTETVLLEGLAVDTRFDDNVDTTIGKAPLSKLPPGRYVRARVPVGYAKWSVTGRLHSGIGTADGRYDSLIAMADGISLEGSVRARGWTSVVFTTPGFAPTRTETTSPLPQPPSDSPFVLSTEGNVAFYEFPVDFTIEPGIDRDLKAILTMNTHEDFRWIDAPIVGNTAGVWDTTTSAYETIVGFGANSATLTIE